MNIKCIAALLGSITMLAASSVWSADALIPAENPIDDSYYDNTNHNPRIDFTDIYLEYNQSNTGKKKNGDGQNGRFFAESTNTSTFTFAYDGSPYGGQSFTADFFLDSSIDRATGDLNYGSFSFVSSDALFGFGEEEVCNKKGNNCSMQPIAGEVFGGDLSDFGWSDSAGFLEFETTNFTGWACDMGWCTTTERLWFNVNGGTLGLTDDFNKVTSWAGTADGSAVIPVPAAVWLFGSGLIGLVGLARRRKA